MLHAQSCGHGSFSTSGNNVTNIQSTTPTAICRAAIRVGTHSLLHAIGATLTVDGLLKVAAVNSVLMACTLGPRRTTLLTLFAGTVVITVSTIRTVAAHKTVPPKGQSGQALLRGLAQGDDAGVWQGALALVDTFSRYVRPLLARSRGPSGLSMSWKRRLHHSTPPLAERAAFAPQAGRNVSRPASAAATGDAGTSAGRAAVALHDCDSPPHAHGCRPGTKRRQP